MLAHLVPLGTPGVLIPFIVLIETISNVIRPGTLAVRLAANMIAGHLLLVLLGNQGPSITFSLLRVLLVTQILSLTLCAVLALANARPQTFQATGTGTGFGSGAAPLFAGNGATPLLGGAALPFAGQQPGGQLAFPGFNLGSGSGAGAGTGAAGPGGVSASGVGIASAQNGGSSTGTGTGAAALNAFTGEASAAGTGSGSSSGK